MPLKTAGERTAVGCWGPAAPRCGSRRLRLAPLHHVRPAGALRARVARAGGRISGAAGKAGPPGPSTRLPELQDLPLPAPPARAVGTLRAQGCPWPGPGGWWSAWTRPLHLPALQFFTHLGRPLEAPIPPALAPALGTSFAAESWSVASEGKFQACPCGGGLRGQVCAGTRREQPCPHLLRGLPSPHPSACGSSTAPLSWGAALRCGSVGKMCLGDVHLEPIGSASGLGFPVLRLRGAAAG